MERREVALEDDAFAARIPDQHLRPVSLGAVRGGGQHQLGAQLVEVERDDLAEARTTAPLEDDIAAGLQCQAVQGGLKGEPASVDRGGQRKDRRFEFRPCLAEARQLSGEPGVHGHKGTVSLRGRPRNQVTAGAPWPPALGCDRVAVRTNLSVLRPRRQRDAALLACGDAAWRRRRRWPRRRARRPRWRYRARCGGR